jgi:hypothetical protein
VLKIIDERQEWRLTNNLFYHGNVGAYAHVASATFAQAGSGTAQVCSGPLTLLMHLIFNF